MKEITDRLETGIQELFGSERYKAYLTTMSKFHSYSFNNTLLIAMQGGQLVAGYNKWRDDFQRNVKKGEKAIKILAPAPFKAKKEVPKLDVYKRQALYFLKFKKEKADTTGNDDLAEYDFGEDEDDEDEPAPEMDDDTDDDLLDEDEPKKEDE